MNQQEWATSKDPAAMWRCVEATATERQCYHFVNACLAHMGATTIPHDSLIRMVAVTWATRNGYCDEVPLAHRADLLREIFGDPFRKILWRVGDQNWIDKSKGGYIYHQLGEMPVNAMLLDPAWLRWQDGSIPWMARTIYGETTPCTHCLGSGGGIERHDNGYHHPFKHVMIPPAPPCDHCNRTGSVMSEFRAADLPLLADALEEAGCAELAILDHLRGKRKCPCCGGDGRLSDDFREPATIQCRACQPWGSGVAALPIPCVRGCWALELLLGDEGR